MIEWILLFSHEANSDIPAAHDNLFSYNLHHEIVLEETKLFIFKVLQNFLNTAGITLFTIIKLTIDFSFSQDFQISFRLFEAKFAPRRCLTAVLFFSTSCHQTVGVFPKHLIT